MIAARVIMTALGSSGSAVFVDRGSVSGVEKGMAVVTPDGIVGKVLAAYPTASQVLLASDPSFAAGVVSQKNHVQGILKGMGHGNCRVDYVQNEEKVESGEWFYTSGEDRIFPKGLPAGHATSARASNPFQEIIVEPSGLTGGLEEVLIIVQGVHQEIPDLKTAAQPIYLAPPAPASPGEAQSPPAQAASTGGSATSPVLATDADKIREHYQELGAAQNHKFGDNPPGTKAVDFNLQSAPGEKPATVKAGADGETRRRGEGGSSTSNPNTHSAAPAAPPSSDPRVSPSQPKAAPRSGVPAPQPKPATANPPAEQ
jgi:rod shape-determining protein MreC